MSQNSEKTNIDWHSGFYAAASLEFRKENYELQREYALSKQPLRIDVLIKKKTDAPSKNELAHLFRKHNIIEYKSPGDNLTVEDVMKTLGYAYLYIGVSEYCGAILPRDVTVSIFREDYPQKVFRELQQLGYKLAKYRPGIYYVQGQSLLPIQIVVTGEIEAHEHLALKMLSKSLKVTEVEEFLVQSSLLKDRKDRQDIDAILQVSLNANKKVFDEVRRSTIMSCEALRELMKEDLEAEKIKGIAIGEERGMKQSTTKFAMNMIQEGYTDAQILKLLPEWTVEKIAILRQNLELKN